MLEFKDKEFPSGLEEAVKNVKSNELATLLKNSITVVNNFSKELIETTDKLSGSDKVVQGDVDTILDVEKKIVELHNKFNNAIKALK